ncbi:BSD-domain-containing protein [Xylariaceae sp. FL0255]|nr:BSD-domain-containing protein [Xylariaceae sp. FL0255]
MDLVYDHINEQSLPKENNSGEGSSGSSSQQPQPTLQEEIGDTINTVKERVNIDEISSKLGSLGNWWSSTYKTVRQQGENYYREAREEVSSLSADASRQLANLRVRSGTLTGSSTSDSTANPTNESSQDKDKEKDGQTTPTATSSGLTVSSLLSRVQNSKLAERAAENLKILQQAEDKMDEALIKTGTNLFNMFQDAITVTADSSSQTRTFESKDDSGKRVIHSSRYDAHLHVLHTTEKSFTEDPDTPEFETWAKSEFDIDAKTEDIKADLEKYPELNARFQKLKETVQYADFWRRYYFLRNSLDTAEAKRQETLKDLFTAAKSFTGATGWGEDEEDWGEDDEEDDTKTTTTKAAERPASTESSTTIHPPKAAAAAAADPSTLLKPSEPRKSNDEKSQADSDTSYDVVGARSGVPSQAPSSPKESRKVEEDSDDEEWE